MSTKIFVNLPVKDLERSKAFFTKLGYTFNPQFTNEKAGCMVITQDIFVMLLTEPFFKSFIENEIADATKATEVLVCLSAESRDDVNRLADTAIEAGGKAHKEPQDHGFMYTRGFRDIDGHVWEISWMDLAAIQQQ